MIATLTVLVAAVAIGFPLSRRPLVPRLGEAFLLGCGAIWAAMMLLSLVHVTWSPASVGVTLALALACAWVLARRALEPGPRLTWTDLATAVILGGALLFASSGTPWEFDYLTDFGLKARAFFEHGGIDWSYLRTLGWVRSFHPDYPLLPTMVYDAVSAVAGSWTDRWLGLVTWSFGLALVLYLRGELADELGTTQLAALATVVIAPLAMSPWMGMADGPVCSYITTSVLSLRRALRNGTSLVPGAVLLGLAASTKNEGLSMVVAVAIGLVAAGEWRKLLRLWPTAAIAAPWLVLRAAHGLSNDLTREGLMTRVLWRLEHPSSVLIPLARYTAGRPLLWLGVALALVVCIRELVARERFTLVAIAAQFAFYLAAYLTSPHDADWHVHWSWERLVSHLTPLLVFVVGTAAMKKVATANHPVILSREDGEGPPVTKLQASAGSQEPTSS